MGISSQKKKDFIVNAKNYLENAGADSFIKEQILTIGYDEKRLNEGRAMQKKAWETRERQIILMNKAKSLHTQLREGFMLRFKNFTDDVRLFRSTFIRNIPVKEKLQLLEKVGILVRSSRLRRKSKAESDAGASEQTLEQT